MDLTASLHIHKKDLHYFLGILLYETHTLFLELAILNTLIMINSCCFSTLPMYLRKEVYGYFRSILLGVLLGTRLRRCSYPLIRQTY